MEDESSDLRPEHASSVTCREYTGLECDFVAGPDESGVGARGHVSTQVITALSMHMATVHRSALSQQDRDDIRRKVSW